MLCENARESRAASARRRDQREERGVRVRPAEREIVHRVARVERVLGTSDPRDPRLARGPGYDLQSGIRGRAGRDGELDALGRRGGAPGSGAHTGENFVQHSVGGFNRAADAEGILTEAGDVGSGEARFEGGGEGV